MRRRDFLRTAVLASLLPLPARAQQAKKLARVGYLSGASAENDKTRVAAFRQELNALGYIEGKNLLLEQRYAAGQLEKLPELAAELVNLKIDVFVVYGVPPAANAAMRASATIPIVFTVSPDPVADRLVASLARPGGQLTGFSDLHSALVTKRLELLKEIVPSLSRVAVLMNPGSPANRLQVKDIQAAAPSLGVAVRSFGITHSEDVDRAFGAIKAERLEGVIVLGDFLLATHRGRIIKLSVSSRLPAIFTTRENAQAGGLMSYGANFPELWRRAAAYVDKILKGAKPGDLPIEQPTKFEVVINLRTAKAIGVTVPRSLLARADEVIE